jgi:hypothetical protein
MAVRGETHEDLARRKPDEESCDVRPNCGGTVYGCPIKGATIAIRCRSRIDQHSQKALLRFPASPGPAPFRKPTRGHRQDQSSSLGLCGNAVVRLPR